MQNAEPYEAIVTIKDMARVLGVSERTARRRRSELVQAGILRPASKSGYKVRGNLERVRRALKL